MDCGPEAHSSGPGPVAPLGVLLGLGPLPAVGAYPILVVVSDKLTVRDPWRQLAFVRQC